MLKGAGGWLFRRLAEPATRGMSVDDPALTERRRELGRSKAGLRLSYAAWYGEFEAVDRAAPPGARIEIGSGGGFLERHLPGLIRSDVLALPELDVRCRAEALPFAPDCAGAIFLVNVLHHVPRPAVFLDEARRVLRPGGYVALVEPWVSALSRRLYGSLHPEPFDPEAPEWELPPAGPLSGGNNALPWIVFGRDRERFERRFPQLELLAVRPQAALAHLFSGGVMVRSLLPAAAFPLLQRLEARLARSWHERLALFATIVLRRRS